jgi:hypothetical protein
VSHFDGRRRVHSGKVAPVEICGSLPLEARHTREPDRTVDSPFRPNVMTRLDEVARLLALGYLRMRARRQAAKANKPNHFSRLGLDFVAARSVSDTDAHGHRKRR